MPKPKAKPKTKPLPKKKDPKVKFRQVQDTYEKFFVGDIPSAEAEKALKTLTVKELKLLAKTEPVDLTGLRLKKDIISMFIYAELPDVPGPKKKKEEVVLTATTRQRELEKLTVAKLKELAKTSGIKLTGLTRKADIVKALLVGSAAEVPGAKAKVKAKPKTSKGKKK